MSGVISKCENNRMQVGTSSDDNCAKMVYALAMNVTGHPSICRSQAPQRRIRHEGICAPSVLGAMVASRMRLDFSKKHRPAVRCLEMSNFLRSISSSKAVPYGSGETYIIAMSVAPVRYSDTTSAAMAFFNFCLSLIVIRAALVPIVWGRVSDL
jgi:hypothetical protein